MESRYRSCHYLNQCWPIFPTPYGVTSPNELTHGNKDHWYTGLHHLVAALEMAYYLAGQPLGDLKEILDRLSAIF